jgi:hypothetical protein
MMELINETYLAAADSGALRVRKARRGHLVDEDLAGVRVFQQPGNVQQRRLACARGRNQRDGLA